MKQVKKLQIGKNGLTQGFIEQIKKIFEDKGTEFIKVSILKSCCRNKEEAEKIGEKLIGELGKNYTYRLVGYVLSVRKWKK